MTIGHLRRRGKKSREFSIDVDRSADGKRLKHYENIKGPRRVAQ